MFSIYSLKDDQEYIYHGDRTRDEIVKFALRLSGPPVQEITKPESFNTIKKDRNLYFLYVGDRSGFLWVNKFSFQFYKILQSRLESLQ
jgi:thioredoxin domain-containing protein 10